MLQSAAVGISNNASDLYLVKAPKNIKAKKKMFAKAEIKLKRQCNRKMVESKT